MLTIFVTIIPASRLLLLTFQSCSIADVENDKLSKGLMYLNIGLTVYIILFIEK